MTPESVTSSQTVEKSAPLWRAKDILSCVGGDFVGADLSWLQDVTCARVHTDSRTTEQGDLFIPIKGPMVDGHDYIKQAFESGATLALCSRSYYKVHTKDLALLPLILVEDTVQALESLGKAARARSQAIIVGVTGSYGKTSFKDALAHALSTFGPTHKTKRSFNNHWGLPLTLANLHPEDRYAVIEMGMNHAGEIADLTRQVRPHVAVITNTGDAHIGNLGSLTAIADAKAEIFEGLEDSLDNLCRKSAVLWSGNWATEHHKDILETQGVNVMTFGENGDFHVTTELSPPGTLISVSHERDAATVTLPLFSHKWGLNAAAVAACLHTIRLSWQDGVASLATIEVSSGRGQVIQSQCGVTIIDESYNAAPGSMAEALTTLIELKRKTKRRIIAVMGEMLELGETAKTLHQNLANIEGFEMIDKVYVSGDMIDHLYQQLPTAQQGLSSLQPEVVAQQVCQDLEEGDILLIKGSRGQWASRGRMSVVVDALLAVAKDKLPNQKKEGALC